jgi:hypothetical protein
MAMPELMRNSGVDGGESSGTGRTDAPIERDAGWRRPSPAFSWNFDEQGWREST